MFKTSHMEKNVIPQIKPLAQFKLNLQMYFPFFGVENIKLHILCKDHIDIAEILKTQYVV